MHITPPADDYGLQKLIPLQMSTPSLHRFLQPMGEMSGMGLVWRFMGISPEYQMFAGLLEVIPGVLLCFRRTRLPGALLHRYETAHLGPAGAGRPSRPEMRGECSRARSR